MAPGLDDYIPRLCVFASPHTAGPLQFHGSSESSTTVPSLSQGHSTSHCRVEAPHPYHRIPKAATVDVLFSQTESLETTTPRTSPNPSGRFY